MASGNSGSLADRINFLFETVRPPNEGRPYTNAEVARGTNLSSTQIGYLRNGQRDNPSVESLRSIAAFFGVAPSYLLDDDPATISGIEAQVKLAKILANDQVKGLALRLLDANPSPQALQAITEMIEHVLRLDAAQARSHRPSNTPPT